MKRKLIWTLLVAAMILGLALPAAAQMGPEGAPRHQGPRHQPPPFWRDAETAQALGLSEEQINSLEDLAYTFRGQEITLRAQLETAQLELERAMHDSAANEQIVLKAARKVADLQGQLFVLGAEHQLKVRKVLTTDQWKKLEAMRPPHGPGQGRGRGHGGPGRDQGGPPPNAD